MDKRNFIYRIDAENRISFLNREWLDFAGENEAPELTAEQVLGKPLESFIAGWESRHLYELVYASVRRSGRETHLSFNCDSPSRRRSFRMRIVPLPAAGLEFVVEVVRIEPFAQPFLERHVERSPEIVVICSWCKKLRLADDGWQAIGEVPAKDRLFATPPPSLSHGVCPQCLASLRSQFDEGR